MQAKFNSFNIAIFLILMLTVVSGCSWTHSHTLLDTLNAPLQEKELISKFHEADSIANLYATDDSLRAMRAIDTAGNKISRYIIGNLNLKAENWVAFVHYVDTGDVEHRLMLRLPLIAKHSIFDNHRETINLDCDSLENFRQMLKQFEVGDLVLVSGNFEASGNSVNTSPPFSSTDAGGYMQKIATPILRLQLVSIKKIPEKKL